VKPKQSPLNGSAHGPNFSFQLRETRKVAHAHVLLHDWPRVTFALPDGQLVLVVKVPALVYPCFTLAS
jgi:hypothetical protein